MPRVNAVPSTFFRNFLHDEIAIAKMKMDPLASRDPRAKFLALLMLGTFVMASRSYAPLLVAAGICSVGMVTSSLSLKSVLLHFRRVSWFVLVIIGIQTLTASGRVLFSIGEVYGTLEGLQEGIFLSLKIVLLLFFSVLFVESTRFEEMLDGAELTLARFKNSGSLFLLLSITLSAVPQFIRSARRIKAAQLARGADVSSSFFRQIRFASSAALPLFISTFRSAHHLAEAIDARGFQHEGVRTPFRPQRFQANDWLMLGILLFVTCASLVAEIMCS